MYPSKIAQRASPLPLWLAGYLARPSEFGTVEVGVCGSIPSERREQVSKGCKENTALNQQCPLVSTGSYIYQQYEVTDKAKPSGQYMWLAALKC